MQSELKPCPFCGGTEIHTYDNGHEEWLKCDDCDASGPYTKDDADAGLSLKDAWNRRAALSDKQAVEVQAEYSHEDRVTLASCLSWDINEITPSDVKGILERLEIEGYRLVRSALVDVPAVEPVGETGEMPGSNGGFTMAVFKASDVPVGTQLYASPPLSREGEDSAEVLRSALQRISELTPARANAKDARDIHLTVKAIADAALAATRSASATTASGTDDTCPGEHQEVLDAIQSHNSGEDE